MTLLVSFAMCLALYASVAHLGYFSETHTYAGTIRGAQSWWQCFDPSLAHFRPLQHLFFYSLTGPTLTSPGVAPELARIPAFLLHCGSAILVGALAFSLGAPRKHAPLASLLFLLAPNVKGLVWVVAIAGPGRLFFLLAALLCHERHSRRGDLLSGLGLWLCFVCALGFHQSAAVLPALLWVREVLREEGGLVERLRVGTRHLFRPALAAVCVTGLLHATFVALRDGRHHGVREWEALPANVAKAILVLLPEDIRWQALEGFRGHAGGLGWLVAGCVVLGLLAFAIHLLRRGSLVTRFALLAIAMDQVLPVLTTGYTQRYAYFASAIAACALILALRSGPSARVLALLLAFGWGWDQVRDVREYRQADLVSERFLAACAEARLEFGEATVTLVDPPDVWGRERDLPIFNWGLREALLARGVPGPWDLVRTRAYVSSSDVRRITEEQLDSRLADPRAHVFIYDEGEACLIAWKGVVDQGIRPNSR